MNTFTLKDLLQVTDLGTPVLVEETDPNYITGHCFEPNFAGELLYSLPEATLNGYVFAVDIIRRRNDRVLAYSVVNKEYQP